MDYEKYAKDFRKKGKVFSIYTNTPMSLLKKGNTDEFIERAT